LIQTILFFFSNSSFFNFSKIESNKKFKEENLKLEKEKIWENIQKFTILRREDLKYEIFRTLKFERKKENEIKKQNEIKNQIIQNELKKQKIDSKNDFNENNNENKIKNTIKNINNDFWLNILIKKFWKYFIYKNTDFIQNKFIEKLNKEMELPETIADKIIFKQFILGEDSPKFENIKFKYLGKQKIILLNFNFEWEAKDFQIFFETKVWINKPPHFIGIPLKFGIKNFYIKGEVVVQFYSEKKITKTTEDGFEYVNKNKIDNNNNNSNTDNNTNIKNEENKKNENDENEFDIPPDFFEDDSKNWNMIKFYFKDEP
jgi:hypothetical protein